MSSDELGKSYFDIYPSSVANFFEQCSRYPNVHIKPLEIQTYSRRSSSIGYSNIVDPYKGELFDIGDVAATLGASTCTIALISGEVGSKKFALAHLGNNTGLPRNFNIAESLSEILGVPKFVLVGANPDQDGDKHRENQIKIIQEQFLSHDVIIPRENFQTIWNDVPDSFINLQGTVGADSSPDLQIELVAKLQK